VKRQRAGGGVLRRRPRLLGGAQVALLKRNMQKWRVGSDALSKRESRQFHSRHNRQQAAGRSPFLPPHCPHSIELPLSTALLSAPSLHLHQPSLLPLPWT
jgi:hypothetical protein